MQRLGLVYSVAPPGLEVMDCGPTAHAVGYLLPHLRCCRLKNVFPPSLAFDYTPTVILDLEGLPGTAADLSSVP